MTRGKHSSGYDDYEDYDDGYDDYYDDFDEDYPKPSSASKLPTSERKTLTQKATPKNKLWSCTVCTFENIEGAAVCDICGTSRFQASTQSKPSNESSAKKVISGEKGSTVKQKASHEEKDLNTSSKDTQVNLDSMEMLNQATEKLKGVDIKTETEKGKHRREPCPPLDTYEPEEWMLETFKQESKQLLHLAIVGHVDAGKSTLMGRLLHILGQVSKKEMHKYEREAKQSGKGSFSYAWVLDESSEERARGITMTVAVAQFETPKFHIVVLDSPGHKDFVPNMISGASQADAAVLVIDACTGAFEAGMEGEGQGVGQTKEHTQLVRSFGVEQLVVAVNKMDAVEYSEDRFNAIKTSLRPFLKHCGFKESGIRWIPLSAMENENLVTQPVNGQMLWQVSCFPVF
ncbi:hypothetical protein KP509_25G022100 [Ceratopteris richardii]|uniref:Tr-type G domain-containing protein n=1 Tax=Ceratopteris richardii TaxID=49495 RepID=A0A8T2RQP6_CERRI|nr:hypothetical protein KP509_25G022100 [Ceratopteris richardii]